MSPIHEFFPSRERRCSLKLYRVNKPITVVLFYALMTTPLEKELNHLTLLHDVGERTVTLPLQKPDGHRFLFFALFYW